MRKIPVISWVAAGRWTETGETFLEEDVIEWIETDVKGDHNFGLKIKGDSMEPELSSPEAMGLVSQREQAVPFPLAPLTPEVKEGEVVVINPIAKAENGDYVIVKNHEEEATFKQYKRYDNTKILHPLNPRYNDIVLNKDKEYRIVGVVMEKKKRYK